MKSKVGLRFQTGGETSDIPGLPSGIFGQTFRRKQAAARAVTACLRHNRVILYRSCFPSRNNFAGGEELGGGEQKTSVSRF